MALHPVVVSGGNELRAQALGALGQEVEHERPAEDDHSTLMVAIILALADRVALRAGGIHVAAVPEGVVIAVFEVEAHVANDEERLRERDRNRLRGGGIRGMEG